MEVDIDSFPKPDFNHRGHAIGRFISAMRITDQDASVTKSDVELQRRVWPGCDLKESSSISQRSLIYTISFFAWL